MATVLELNIPLKVSGDSTIRLKVAEGNPFYPIYEGRTEIEPKTVEQVVETANTAVLEDIKVHKIPYFETSNVHGVTAIIGGNG